MNRKLFAIWFAIFIMLQWPLTTLLMGNYSYIELLLLMVLFALLLSNIFGIVYVGLICYEIIPEIWNYFFHNPQWLKVHSHGIGTPGYSFDNIFWQHEVLLLVLAVVVVIHLFLCAKRCKTIGISVWWILLPLYNPFVLLFRKN